MIEDFIDKSFADLDVYYPGSKRKRKPVVVKEPKVHPDLMWDAKPYKKTLPNGRDLEMFTIGALADALGRPVITIRAWLKEGYLPASPYRLPTKKNVKGEDQAGRRLYSRAMVEKVIELFSTAGLLEIKRINWSEHKQLSNKIAEAWNQIRAEENKIKSN
jgi:DNA-binding transcriptional MerR regulator